MAQHSHTLRIGAMTGLIAAASMATTPAYAAELPIADTAHGSAVGLDFGQGTVLDPAIYTGEAQESEYYRRYRPYRRYRRGRIRGGDILAGVLVLGGIAAVASAASNSERRSRERERRRYRDYDRRYDDRRYDNDRQSNPRSSNGSGIDNAVSQCLTQIERDVRVEEVSGASRVASGWVVSGTLFNGSGFTCQIDNNGRISNVDYGSLSSVNYSDQDGQAAGQWSDARYAEARSAMRADTDIQRVDPDRPNQAVTDGPRPAYPGGPLPGDEGYSEPAAGG